jgi:hypothetical protein
MVVAALLLGPAIPARGQSLDVDPVVLANGRVTVAGDVTATFSCAKLPGTTECGKDDGFFNYSDYENSMLRMVRVGLKASVRASRQVAVLAEVRTENDSLPEPYGLYVRVRPWATRNFDLQIGRIPPTFGAFPRRAYSSDNLLIGYPLAYQYLTSLRTDALPDSNDAVLRMRGRGWLSDFPLGNIERAPGLPLVNAFRWDTGIQAHGGTEWLEGAVSITNGSPSHPLVRDDNAGKQIAARFAARPVAGLVVGVSGARAPYLTRTVVRAVGRESEGNTFAQQTFGGDVEYSRDYYLLRSETVISRWHLPTIAPTLSALAVMVEGRYKLRPGFYTAARVDHLGFGEITGATRTAAWDAPVTRVEVGAGYLIQRNLEFMVSLQRNVRDGGRVPRLTIGAAQLGFWF